MVASKEWTKTDPKDTKSIALPTCMSKLEEKKASILATVPGGGRNRTYNRTGTKVR